MYFKDEAAFNTAIRDLFEAHGLRVIHVVEANKPGPLDLVVWHKRVFIGWVELKIDDEQIRASQHEFMRDNPECCATIRWLTTADCAIVETYTGLLPKRMSWAQLSHWVKSLKDWADNCSPD